MVKVISLLMTSILVISLVFSFALVLADNGNGNRQQGVMSGADDDDEDEDEIEEVKINCLNYTYSTCPANCKAVCVPSSCSFDIGTNSTICTADCDGAGSCIKDKDNKTIIKENKTINNYGQQVKIEVHEKNRIRLESKNISADCDCNLSEEREGNKTKLKIKLSNGKYSEIKIMPDTASERALERLRLKVCSKENNCTIILKETGQDNQTRATYEIQIQRHSRILGIFEKKMQTRTWVDAETGEVKVHKPWWAFLAAEPEEDETTEENNSSENNASE